MADLSSRLLQRPVQPESDKAPGEVVVAEAHEVQSWHNRRNDIPTRAVEVTVNEGVFDVVCLTVQQSRILDIYMTNTKWCLLLCLFYSVAVKPAAP